MNTRNTTAFGNFSDNKGGMPVKERRKWDALIILLLFVLVLLASVLFNISFHHAEPMIAGSGAY